MQAAKNGPPQALRARLDCAGSTSAPVSIALAASGVSQRVM